jgi:hypothetical protein
VYFEGTFNSLITLLEKKKDLKTYMHSSLKLGVRMFPLLSLTIYLMFKV